MSKYNIQTTNQASFRSNNSGIESPNFKNLSNSNVDFNNSDRLDSYLTKQPTRGQPLPDPKKKKNNFHLSDDSLDDNKKPFQPEAVISISLGNLGEKEIRCSLDEDPGNLAQRFCIENSLAKEAAPIIINMINKQFKILKKKQQKKSVQKKESEDNAKVDQTGQFGNLKGLVESVKKEQERDSEDPNQEKPRNKTSVTSRGDRLLAKLDININPKETRELCLYKGEDPVEVAQEFCYQNNLPENVMDILITSLNKALAQYEAKKSKKRSSLVTPEFDSHTKQSEHKTSGADKASTNYTFNPKSEQNNAQNDTNVAEKYERWQNLLKEKEKIKQIESMNQGGEGESKFMKTEEREDLYNMAMTSLAPRSNSKSPRASHMSGGSNRSVTLKNPNQLRLTYEEINEMTNRFYAKARAHDAKVERMRAERQEERQREEEKHLTFQPNADRSKSSEPLARRFMNIEADRRKWEKLAQTRLEMIADECPFQPSLTDRTRELTRTRSKSPIDFYHEGMAWNKHKEDWREMAFKEVYPFKPTLPHDVDKFTQKRPKQNQKEFIERLIQEKYDKELRQIKKRLEQNTGKDPKTGQPLHHPVFTHDKFYWKIKERDDAKATLVLDVETLQVKRRDNSPSKAHVKRVGGLKYIFDKLDNDKDNQISSTQMDVSKLEDPILEVLCDFFNWLDDQQAVLDFPQFCSAIENLNLEQKVHEALDQVRVNNPTISNEYLMKYFESYREPRANKLDIVYPSQKYPVYNPDKKAPRSKTPTPISDKTLNYSKESNKLTRHYQEILNRKNSEKISDFSSRGQN